MGSLAMKHDEAKKTPSVVPAVEQAALVLLCLARSPSPKMNLTDICREVGIHKSKGYAILGTLQRHGFIERDDGDKRYSLGTGLIGLSRKVLDNSSIRDVVKGSLEELAALTKSTALYGVVNGDSLFVVAKEEGGEGFGITLRVGHRFPLTAGAHGKAIVAAMAESEREETLKGAELYFHGDPKGLDRERLDEELRACQKRGFAEDAGELQSGINALAAAVLSSGGTVTGVIFILGTFPKKLFKRYGAIVAQSAQRLSSLFGYSKDRQGRI